MKHGLALMMAFVGLASTGFMFSANAQSTQASEPAHTQAQALDGNFVGTLVCEQLPFAAGPLRAPLDLTIAGNKATFARPVFNLEGTRVLGSEVGTGTLEPDGKLHLVSSWVVNGGTAQGTYDGTLTARGGTLTGSQSWTLGGEPRARQCFAALVKTRQQERQQETPTH
jgi:hypothetical protein